MRAAWTAGLLSILAAGGCGDRESEPEKPPMKVEETVFRDLVGTQDKARDRTNQAIEQHRQALDEQINNDEAPPVEE